jgi:hypothetical protein
MTAANRRTSLPSLSLLCLKEVAFILFSPAPAPAEDSARFVAHATTETIEELFLKQALVIRASRRV